MIKQINTLTTQFTHNMVSEWLLLAALLGGILFVGLFNLVIYWGRKEHKIYYFFGQVCIYYFVWYANGVATFEVFSISVHHREIISAISINRLLYYFLLYLFHTLEIRNLMYEKGLRIGFNVLFIACFFMPFSVDYSKILIQVISVFNICAVLYLMAETTRIMKFIRKDVRIISVVTYLLVCVIAVTKALELNIEDKTLFLAFIIIAAQSIILAKRYHEALNKVERANETLEQKVAARTSELVQKEKETIQLILSISHDLRTPISVVGGYMELLQRNSKIDDLNKEYIASSIVRLSQMEKLTEDLFTLSQLSDRNYTLELETLNIAEEIQRVAALYSKQAEKKGVKLRIDIKAFLCIADRMRVMQVLDNLMANALSYAKSIITIRTIASDGFIKVVISDDGSGINPEELPYIFDRYYKKRQRGSGLGLSNVRELVQRMNGRVTVESVPNVRTSFTFTLPQKVEKEVES